MTIASILRGKGGEIVTAEVATPALDIVALLHRHRIGALIVVDGGGIAGIVSERDIVRCLHEKGGAVLGATAGELMTTPVLTVAPGDSIDSAMELITERRVRHLPVVDGGALVGIVSIGDLVKRRIEDAEAEAARLKDYIAS